MKDLDIQPQYNKILKETEKKISKTIDDLIRTMIEHGIKTYRLIKQESEKQEIQLPENIIHSIVRLAVRSLLLDIIHTLIVLGLDSENSIGIVISMIEKKQNKNKPNYHT